MVFMNDRETEEVEDAAPIRTDNDDCSAQLSNAVFAAQTRNHDPDLLLPAGSPAGYPVPPSPLPRIASPLSTSSPLFPRWAADEPG
jgi:hypothetical protein